METQCRTCGSQDYILKNYDRYCNHCGNRYIVENPLLKMLKKLLSRLLNSKPNSQNQISGDNSVNIQVGGDIRVIKK